MRETCVSVDGLAGVAAAYAEDVRLLLTLLSKADDLDQLGTLSCLTISSGPPALARIGAVEIEGRPMRIRSGALHGSLGRLDASSGFMIDEIRIDGLPLLRAAG